MSDCIRASKKQYIKDSKCKIVIYLVKKNLLAKCNHHLSTYDKLAENTFLEDVPHFVISGS